MNEITKIKNEVKLKQWVEMIQQRNESGLTGVSRTGSISRHITTV